MKPNIITSTLIFVVAMVALLSASQAQTAASDQPPAVSEEARKCFVMGATVMKDAKSADDFTLAISKFKQATELAPQWPEARYNLAWAKEAAGDFSGAIQDWKIYQQFKLPEDEARKLQDKIYALEAKQEMAATAAAKEAAEARAKESSPEAVAAKKQKQEGEFIKLLDGAAYSRTDTTAGGWSHLYRIEIKNGQAIFMRKTEKAPRDIPVQIGEWVELADLEGRITGREWTGKSDDLWETTFIISEDGNRITQRNERRPGNPYESFENIYQREKQ